MKFTVFNIASGVFICICICIFIYIIINKKPTPTISCSSGYTLVDKSLIHEKGLKYCLEDCPVNYTRNGNGKWCQKTPYPLKNIPGICPDNNIDSSGLCNVSLICPPNYMLSDNLCIENCINGIIDNNICTIIKMSDIKNPDYTCPEGYILKDKICNKN